MPCSFPSFPREAGVALRPGPHRVLEDVCESVCVVRKICRFFVHGAGKAIAVGFRISPIPVLSYNGSLIEF